MSAAIRRLIGDIGGTNARFAISDGTGYANLNTLAGTDYPSFEAAIAAYLDKLPASERPREAAFAIAGPITGDVVTFTNQPWQFSQAELKQRFGFERLAVVNDFTANALSLPYLTPADVDRVGGGKAKPSAAMGILGPGTGLGISGLLRAEDGSWVPVKGEGGHATLAASNDRESQIIALLRAKYDHVSAERVLSGDGLVNLYECLCQLDGKHSAGLKPAQITDAAVKQTDPICVDAVANFCAILGSVAGDLALLLGAEGGIYIAGGIIPRLGPIFAGSPFRARFEAKGRFRAYLSAIPTAVISHTNPALLGLSRAF
jgi:glucokinase